MVVSETHLNSSSGAEYSFMDLDDSAQVMLVLTPRGRGTFREQVQEVLSALHAVLDKQLQPMTVTVQTVFLRDPHDRVRCEQILAVHYGSRLPVTNFVLQPPCCGAALAMEVWAIGGDLVRVDYFSPQTLAVSYNRVRWVYCAGITPAGPASGAYTQTLAALKWMRAALDQAGSGFEHVIRTWFYLGGITEPEANTQRYEELNRARTDLYRDIHFCSSLLQPDIPHRVYPSSTCIGMAGVGLVASCLALETRRKDVFLLSLENPRQTPAYYYQPRYSLKSPKFSRATALVLGNYVTTWISGTASIVNSESRHLNDVKKQTEQTIDNIERLISPENFSAHGASGAGARLHDFAKIRVYLKRRQDFAKCKAICEHRFGSVPAIYTIADICRPELLVEIEGVAFSRYSPKDTYPLEEAQR
jgi:enamine deaminase RidA (YjgF/YER057c/UK114 family)